MSSEIIAVIDSLCEKLGIAIDWSADNVLPMLQRMVEQYARYLMVNNLMLLTVFGTIFIASVVVFTATQRAVFKRKPWAWNTRYNLSTETADAIRWMCGATASITLIILLFVANSFIKSVTIPEIYATQKLLEMLKAAI